MNEQDTLEILEDIVEHCRQAAQRAGIQPEVLLRAAARACPDQVLSAALTQEISLWAMRRTEGLGS